MRKALGPGHRANFIKNGQISFENVLSEDELHRLKAMSLSCSHPPLLKLIKKRQLAEIVYELIDKEPLRLANAMHTNSFNLIEGDCALIIDLASGLLTYTTLSSFPMEESLVLIFTPRYLYDEPHPVVYRRG